MEIRKLKEEFEKLSVNYKLPSFDELNEDFEIDKIDRESFILLRVVRKAMMDKIINSLSFVEMLLNPMNAPRMYYGFLKLVSQSDKERIEKIYGVLAELIIDSLIGEIEYDEKKEAELISLIYEKWDSVKSDFKMVLEKIKKPANNNFKEKSYYG